MTFSSYDGTLGVQNLAVIDTVGPGRADMVNMPSVQAGFQSFYNEEIRGYDAALGGGTFVYGRYNGTIALGTVVEMTPTLVAGLLVNSATAWAGTANTGKPLAVAIVAGTVGQWGWFQVQGNAIVTTAGTPAAGNPVYYGASAGAVRPTANAGAQVLSAQYSTANSVTVGAGASAILLTSTQAVIYINRPSVQSAIT